jgi:hypothetical protein
MGKLGSKFKKALPEEVATRLKGDAGKLSDDDWKGRLDELAALVKVKADENLDGSEAENEGDPEFSREEAALAGAGAGGGNEPSGGHPATSFDRSASALGRARACRDRATPVTQSEPGDTNSHDAPRCR